ncbi:MAG: PhzF family phenazine biosynthesis protein [Pseudomonadota bacterium]
MDIPFFQVDAFADAVFKGNPAGVCILESWLDDSVLQSIAAENNLSETAFLVPEGTGYRLRWFTPTTEVPLCGHATLASAYVVFEHFRPEAERVRFDTLRSGLLTITRGVEGLTMDLPAHTMTTQPKIDGLEEALGAPFGALNAVSDGMVLVPLANAAAVRDLKPDIARLKAFDKHAFIVTAAGDGMGVDFVSRVFAPSVGIAEDPVTGAAHCALTPYWVARLGRTNLSAWQMSARGGRLGCRLGDDRVYLTGQVIPYLSGTIHI